MSRRSARFLSGALATTLSLALAAGTKPAAAGPPSYPPGAPGAGDRWG